MQKLVINKGYTLEVVSWENDGDYYNTITTTVDTKEKADRYYKICKELFVSCSSKVKGVGNTGNSKGFEALLVFYNSNKELFPDLDISEVKDTEVQQEIIMDYFIDIAHLLMGSPEDYDFRVCQSVNVYYSPEDIYCEQIEF